MESAPKAMNTRELTDTVNRLLDQERRRDSRRDKRKRELAKRQEAERHAQFERMTRSVEVIKWCIIGIVTVMAIFLLVIVMVVMELRREAERIRGEVERIQHEAEVIRDRLRHPLESLGGTLGRKLDSRIGDFIQPDDSP